ncbi:polysaccharide deacetylase [Nakamurella silvestris]|nr:polysaccharide deacetylase [Nakamurella silvestris]
MILGLVLALAVATGILIYQSRSSSNEADNGPVVVTQTKTRQPTDPASTPDTSGDPATSEPGTSGPASTDPATSDPATTDGSETSVVNPPDGRAPTNLPMKKLKKGQKPPQFIIFSFDGAGNSEKLNSFMDTAATTDSRFTGFLTGLYMLTDDKATDYTGPGRNPGESSVGFGGDATEVQQRVTDWNRMWAAGNEMGTHYNGHFCGGSGDAWTQADWTSELDQAFKFVDDYKALDDLPDAQTMKFTSADVKGGRTPCLEGVSDENFPNMAAVWKAHNMTYDTSKPAPYNGIFWPKMLDGIWEFYMPYVYSPSFKGMVTAMDYNFWVKFNGGAEEPDTAPQLRKIVQETYEYMYDQAYNGNRAPILIANHLNNWNGNSFNPAALAFMKETCGKKDTYCTTYQDVIAWMELQDPAVLKDLQDAYPVAEQAPTG